MHSSVIEANNTPIIDVIQNKPVPNRGPNRSRHKINPIDEPLNNRMRNETLM